MVIPQIKHRITRLYPVYMLLIIGAFGVIVLIKSSLAITDLLCHVFFSQNINWMINGYNSDLSVFTAHTWTLSIEVYLFVVWLIAYKYLSTNKQRKLFNCIAGIIAITYRVITVIWITDPMITSLCPIAHMDAFALGAILAHIETEKDDHNIRQRIKYCSLILGLIIILFSIGCTALSEGCNFIDAYRLYKTSSSYLTNPWTSNVYLGFSLITVGLILAVKDISVHKKLTPLVVVGNVSYSAYLIHYPINVLLLQFTNNRWSVLFITFVVSVIAAWIVEKIINIVIFRKKRAI